MDKNRGTICLVHITFEKVGSIVTLKSLMLAAPEVTTLKDKMYFVNMVSSTLDEP